MKIYMLLMVIIFLAGSNSLHAQFSTEVSGVGTSAATFLEIGVSARAIGMGGAYAAQASDPSALFYNPAGIVWLEGIQTEFMYNDWLVDTRHNFLGVTMPLPLFRSTLGFSLVTLDYGDEQAVRTAERPEGTGEYWSAQEYAAGLTYAVALTNRFSFGLTTKYIHQQIWHESGSALALDLGIHYNTGWQGLVLGMSMSNFGTEIQLSGRDLDSTSDPDEDNENVDRIPVRYKTGYYPLPVHFRAGLSWQKNWGVAGSTIMAMDLNHPGTSTEYINLGLEYAFRELLFLRAGYENLFEDNQENGLTLGAGLEYPFHNSFRLRLDYAWSDWGILQDANRFSVGINF